MLFQKGDQFEATVVFRAANFWRSKKDKKDKKSKKETVEEQDSPEASGKSCCFPPMLERSSWFPP